jgi:hypothetical protein
MPIIKSLLLGGVSLFTGGPRLPFDCTTFFSAPKWYSQYRFYLSILVGTCIIGSLAGTSYYGPVAGHGLLSHDLNMIRAERQVFASVMHPDPSSHLLTINRKLSVPERSGYVNGDIEAVAGDEMSDTYVVIRRKHKNGNGDDGDNGEAQAQQ